MNYCENYCGAACVDGSCPIANNDEYNEFRYPTVSRCKQCFYYEGCSDCYFANEDGSCRFEVKDDV